MIHKYTLNGFHIVLDTNSGAVHVFDDAPYDIVGLFRGMKYRSRLPNR